MKKERTEKMNHQSKRRLHERGVSLLCAAAMLSSLILGNLTVTDAVASESILICGQSEHVHSEGCYERQLICGRNEHTHGEGCFDENGGLICSEAEHAHSDGCYENKLICGQSEHRHGSDCYKQQETVPETQPEITPETPTQIQTEAPATDTVQTGSETPAEIIVDTEETQLASNLDTEAPENETQETHMIIESETEKAEELKISVSTKARYAVADKDDLVFATTVSGGTNPYTVKYEIKLDGENVYEQNEFAETITYRPESYGEHTMYMTVTDAKGKTSKAECSVPVSVNETENADIWQQSVQSVTLTGDYAKDIVAIAGTQIGNKENKKNFIIDEEGKTKYYSRYGQWYGDTYEEWSAMFVSFCAAYAQIPEEYLSREKDNSKWVQKLNNLGLYVGQEGYTPQAGDLVFFSENPHREEASQLQSGNPAHVGIVANVDENNIYTIEGNSDGAVSRQQYSLNESKITGYMSMAKVMELAGKLTEKENAAETELVNPGETEAETEGTITLTVAAGNAAVTASYVAGALPEGAQLQVTEISQESDELADLGGIIYAASMEQGKIPVAVYPFEIQFVDAEGTKLQPESAVNVSLEFTDAIAPLGENSSWAVFHVSSEENAEELTGQGTAQVQKDEQNKVSGFTFVSDSFSPYVLAEITEGEGISLTAELPEDIVVSGDLTDTINWAITENELGTITLRISGTGDMPDLGAKSEQPWKNYRGKINKIVVEDGITRIGKYAFCSSAASTVKIGSDVESIGTQAFGSMGNLASIDIPGNVKTLEEKAFTTCRGLTHVTLNEGLEKIGSSVFESTGLQGTFTIPASVEFIGSGWGSCYLSAFEVADGNTTFFSRDGVLFQRQDDGKNKLVTYPTYKKGISYTIPEDTVAIQQGAFSRIKILEELTIPGTVTTPIPNGTFTWSSFTKVIIEDGVTFSGDDREFSYCSNLREITLPDYVVTTMIGTFEGCGALESVTIPRGVKNIYGVALRATNSLQTLIFDADDCTRIYDPFSGASLPRYDLIISKNVNYLRGNKNSSGFKIFAERADSIRFVGPNQITVEEGALNGAPGVLNGLYGTIYVDEQGIVYKYDANDKTASIVYCPAGVSNVTIPGFIEPESDVVCRVTSVENSAFTMAEDLEQITFEVPGQIENIGAKVFFECAKLGQVNGQTTVEGAISSFTDLNPDIEIGQWVFDGTALEGAEGGGIFLQNMDGEKALVIEKGNDKLYVDLSSEGGTLQWSQNDEHPETGGYSLLTGDAANITISTGNTSGTTDIRYRIYFDMREEGGSLSCTPGQTYTFDDQDVKCYATDKESIIYLEFTPPVSGTVSFPVTAVYSSPNTAGGSLKVWGTILNTSEAEEHKGEILSPDSSYIQAMWTTQPDIFALNKTCSSKSVNLVGDGVGGAKLAENLTWQITLKRQEDNTISYGKDFVKSADYVDTMTFPAGIRWSDEVLEAVKNSSTRRVGNNIYAGNTLIAGLSLSGGASFRNLRIQYNEDTDQISLCWSVANPNKKAAEMPVNTITFTIGAAALSADIAAFNEGETHTVTNHVDASLHYTYSKDQILSAEAKRELQAEGKTFDLSKTVSKSEAYMGEDIGYTLNLSNSGAADYDTESTDVCLVDSLSSSLYIKPENMERMFRDELGGNLKVEISKASLAEREPVSGIYGNTAYKNAANSDINTSVATLTVSWNENKNGFLVKTEDSTYSGNTVADALQSAGYSVTADTVYKLSWPLENNTSDSSVEGPESFKLRSGEKRQYKIYATAKDTFQMLKDDYPNRYPQDSFQITNSAVVYGQKNGKKLEIKKSNSASLNVKKDVWLNKTVSHDQIPVSDTLSVGDGTVLDYQINFHHYGNGSYQNLPMVDDLYGVQYLLVPVAGNEALKDRKLETHSKDGVEYYILEEGSYSNVLVGTDDAGQNCYAAVVMVEKVDNGTIAGSTQSYSGIHTQIKWYFPEIPAAGNYVFTVDYSSLVDLTLSNEAISYTIGNTAWLNDRTGDRIYAVILGGGTVLGYDKEIVTEKGDTPEQDVIDEDDHSLVSSGEKVIYRLTLKNENDTRYILPGNLLADALPTTGEKFSWEKGTNVELSWQCDEGTTCTKLDEWQISDQWGAVNPSKEQQYIVWGEDTKLDIAVDGTVYLYVTLTFPDDSTGGVWSEYCSAVGGNKLENTLYVERFSAKVTHNLSEPGEVLLQKGVYGTYWYDDKYGTVVPDYKTSSGRIWYNNTDASGRSVVYYAVLYNGGNTRFYLSDLYDQLPKGFTYRTLVRNGDFENGRSNLSHTSLITTQTTGNLLTDISADVSYRSAQVICEPAANGLLRFQISGGSGSNSVKYDEEEERYYLDRGEAVVFGYLCDVGETGQTENTALNMIGMPYYDALGTGTEIVRGMTITGADNNGTHADQNDGGCSLGTQDNAQQAGFPAEEEVKWLFSDVSLRRGEIIPGLIKYTDSYTTLDGRTEKYTNSAPPDATVNWRVRMYNSGTSALNNYTFTDTVDAPYRFEGDVGLKIYDYQNKSVATYSLKIGERTEGDKEVKIAGYNQTVTVPINGGAKNVTVSNYYAPFSVKISITQNDQGDETLQIEMNSSHVAHTAIPEGGYADMTLSTRNPSSEYANKVYINQAVLTPNVQKFSAVSQGSLIRDENNDPVSVCSSAPVNISFAYATSSEKWVEEVDNEENFASSAEVDKNKITLSKEDSKFRYILGVSNDTDKAMTKLILIDNLPEIGDTSPFDNTVGRGSGFKVKFAENPQIQVNIISPDGKESILDPEYYKVGYQKKTSFEKEDWEGISGNWDKSAADARSIRIVIEDASASQIPAGAKVEVSFIAQIDGAAEPGSVAWNSFGYHYGLKNVPVELEAMPLNVGVKLRNIPKLQKKLTGIDGDPMKATEDEQFCFLVYEGEKLESSNDATALKNALNAAERKYHEIELWVKKGKSDSDTVLMESDNDNWSFRKGETYTVVELPTENYFLQDKWNTDKVDYYTFTYDPEVSQTMTCTNVFQKGSFQLKKTNPQGTGLSGVELKLYIDEATYAPENPQMLNYGGKTYYQIQEITTAVNGNQLDLPVYIYDQASKKYNPVNYLIQEVKTVEGYQLLPNCVPFHFEYKKESQIYSLVVDAEKESSFKLTEGERGIVLQIINYKLYQLPSAGGMGTYLFTISGVAILMTAFLLFILNKRKEKGGYQKVYPKGTL